MDEWMDEQDQDAKLKMDLLSSKGETTNSSSFVSSEVYICKGSSSLFDTLLALGLPLRQRVSEVLACPMLCYQSTYFSLSDPTFKTTVSTLLWNRVRC
jgi:hypothetical protein